MVIVQDVVYAVRGLLRAPLFAVCATLTFAIGVSGVVAVLAILNAFMFRPLAVEGADRLVSVSTRDHHVNFQHGLSFLDLQDYRTDSPVFTDLAGYAPRPAALDVGQGAERIVVELVTDNYFSMLGVRPGLGRLIQPGDGGAPGDAPLLVLTHEYWESRLGSDPSIVGRAARLNGRPLTVIGVTPPTFRGTEALVRVAAYAPVSMLDGLANVTGPSRLHARGDHFLTVLGLLKPDVTLPQARAALDAMTSSLERQHPDTNRGVSLLAVPETQARPNPNIGPVFRFVAAALTALATLLLLVTVANIANLLIARASDRGPEIALRTALGGSRLRLARQLAIEGAVLTLLGSLVAIPAAGIAMRALEAFIARMTSVANLRPDFGLDWRVVAGTLAAATAAGIVAGLAPAVHASRTNLTSLLSSGGRGQVSRARVGWRQALVVGQVAVSVALLVVGGLFLRSLQQARGVDLGFRPQGVFLTSTELTAPGYDAAKRLSFYRTVRDRLVAAPGVESAAWTAWPPLATVRETADILPDTESPGPDRRGLLSFVASIDADYFATLGVPLVSGRPFNDGDRADGQRVVIVNQRLAQQLWPGQSALGRRLRINPSTEAVVVGVARDGKYGDVSETASTMLYRPIAQQPPVRGTIVVRSTQAMSDVASLVRQTIREADPDAAPFDVRSMSDHLNQGPAFAMFRLGAFAAGMFGVIAAFLASVSLYGTIAFLVSRRTREFGVRMALGAERGSIVRSVVASSARVVAIGVAVGFVLASGVALLLRQLLLDVSPWDVPTYVGVAVLLIGIALVAAFVPVYRATGISPVAALRAE